MYDKKSALRKWRGAATGLLILIMPVCLSAQQPVFQQAHFHLPWPMSNLGELTAYIPSQNRIYIFGGIAQPQGWLDTIVKVDLVQEQVSVLNTPLPFSRPDALAVAYNDDDGKVYLFHLADVYRFDPGTETISLIAGNLLPEIAHDYTVAKYVSSQNAIYLFGNRGSGGGNYTLRYDPTNNAVQVLSNTMQPSNNTSPSAAYCDSRDAVYLFGGNFSSSSFNLIQRFEPTGENFFTLPVTLPTIAGGTMAVSVASESAVYVLGGYDNSIALNDVYKFDCTAETLTPMPDLPTPLIGAGAEYASSERRIYILGGITARTGGATDLVYYLNLNSGNTVPIANAGTDQTFECTSSAGANVTLNGTASHDADHDYLTYTWRINGEVVAGPTNNPISQLPLALGSHTIKLTVDDGRGGIDDDEVLIEIVDTTPPAITLNGDSPMVLECHIDSYVELGAQVRDACDHSPSLDISGSVNSNVLGAYDVIYTATDAHGNIASKTRTVNVVDTTPPMITLQSPISLWPPNHKYTLITVERCVAFVGDACAGDIALNQVKIASVSSDEPEDAPDGVCAINDPLHICFNGDGSTIDDIVIARDCRSVNLRSERAASGNGRVYTINFEVSDVSGNVATAAYKISVPHDQDAGGTAVDNGPCYAIFSDCGSSSVSKMTSGNEEASERMIIDKPESYALAQNYPNPFNPETEIRFQIPEANHVVVKIFNTLGEEILTLLDAEYAAGYYAIRWGGRDKNNKPVASGIYLYQLQAGSLVQVKKMNLLR